MLITTQYKMKQFLINQLQWRLAGKGVGRLLLCCLVFLLSTCSDEQKSLPIQKVPTFSSFIGSPSRLVWVQDTHDNKDVSAQGQHLQLVGYDSGDGQGERVILAGPKNFFRPLISPSGEKVVFSDFHQRRVSVVDWSGENLQFLTKGRALAVLRDPGDGLEWIYVGRNGSENGSQGPGSDFLYRVQLENPEIEELLWDKARFGDILLVSGDGRRFSVETGSAACVLVDIESQEVSRQGKGCWPAVAPDQSYRFWFFDGAHRNLEMIDTRQGTRNKIHIAGAPGIDGHEVYHPRWSNNPRYMVMTGPYVIRQGGNNIRGGGGGVEIYVGRFSEDFSDIEAWFQVSSNERADFFPDLWIAEDEKQTPDALFTKEPSSQTEIPVTTSQWPVVNENLLFAWQNVAAKNQWTSPAGKQYQAEIVAEGKARFSLNYQMRLDSGWYLASRSPQPNPEEYSDANSVFLEFVMHVPGQQKQKGTGRLLALGVDSKEQTILRVEENILIVEERRHGQVVESLQLGTIRSGQSHVMLDISPSEVRFTVNNEATKILPRTSQEIITWPLTIGSRDVQNQMGWDILLERITLYSRSLNKQEIERTVQSFIHEQENTATIQAVIVKAELVSAASIPTPEDILPYRRGLVVNEYSIIEQVQGKIEEKNILVAQWAIMDGESLPEAAARTVGQVYELHLDVFDNRPELEGERLSMDSDNLLLTMYYDLGS